MSAIKFGDRVLFEKSKDYPFRGVLPGIAIILQWKDRFFKNNAVKCKKRWSQTSLISKDDTDMSDKNITERLFRQHYGKMIHLARTLLVDDAEAQDVVYEVFARLFEITS